MGIRIQISHTATEAHPGDKILIKNEKSFYFNQIVEVESKGRTGEGLWVKNGEPKPFYYRGKYEKI